MRNVFPAWFLLLLASCIKTDDGKIILAGILKEGAEADSLQMLSYSTDESENASIANSLAVITDEGGNQFEFHFSNGHLINTSGALIPESGKTYQLLVSGDFGTLNSSAIIPPEIDTTSLNQNNYTIDADNPSDVAFLINWNDVTNHSFVLKLENLEASPQPLPFEESGLFNSYYGLPVLETYAVIPANAFRYYGQHRLTVYCINREYEEFFFYSPSDLRNLLGEAPSNIDGGKGYFTGVSSFSLDLFVNP